MMLDAGSTERAGGGSSVWRRHSTHGADIVAVCRAILAPGSGRYLGELGFRAAEVEHEPGGVSPAGRRALLAAYRAYEARRAVVAGILQATASAVAGGRPEGTDDLELLAVLIGRRSFFQLARRFRSVLDGDEQAALIRWASEQAGENISLPDAL